jgi:CheY-like chemotaxis protein
MDERLALIINDDVEISNLFGMLLSLIGYECEIANTARDGLSWLAEIIPSVLFFNVQLSIGSPEGESILHQVRANPRLKDTRVVFLTGTRSPTVPSAYLADHILTRPITLQQLEMLTRNLRIGETAAVQVEAQDNSPEDAEQDIFFAHLEQAIEQAKQRPDYIFAICVIELSLDQPPDSEPVDPTIFESILRDTAKSLSHNFRPTDTIVSLEQAKFVSLHEYLKDPQDINVVVRRIQTVLIPPFHINNRMYKLAYRIGTATSEDDFETAQDLIALAEEDMQKQ